MGDYVELSNWQVAIATLLIVINGVVSILLKLKMEWSLLIASIRTIVQLLLIGVVLEWVFRWERWYIVVGMGSVMTLVAGITAASRNRLGYSGIHWNAIVSVWASSWLVTAFALGFVLQGTDSWYSPQYSIPLLGMVLGNTLNGISVGLNTLTDTLSTQRGQVESLLALGASRWESARQPVQQAIRTGLLPIINSMMVVGIVSLPGMMTGQLVSGMEPMQAVKYQIVIMFLIASATALGTVLIVVLTVYRLFNADHQFCHSRLK